MFLKKLYVNLLKKYKQWGFWRVAMCPSYIQDARFLRLKIGLKLNAVCRA
jgi:hypothetical protein